MTQEINTKPVNTIFYTSPTKKIHAPGCRHCKPDNAGWQKIESIVIAVDEGYQTCRLCCPSDEEIETLRHTTLASSTASSKVVVESQTDDKESLVETKSSDSAIKSKSSKLTAETTTVKTKKTSQQKKAKAEKEVVEVEEKNTDSLQNQTESLIEVETSPVNQVAELPTEVVESKLATKKTKTNQKKKADNPIVEIKAKESDSPQNQPESLINEKINQEIVTEVVELKADENNQTDRDTQPVKETKSQQKAKNKGKTTPSDSDSQKTVENQTQESTEEIKPETKNESETLVETEKQSPETESTPENQTQSKKKKKKKKNKQQSPEDLENQANKAEEGQKSENDADSKSADKSGEESPEPKKEKKRYKILAGNGAHQAIAEVNGILVPPTEPTGKFTLVLPDGLQLEVIFKSPRLRGFALTTNLMIGQHWFRGYPKMQNDKLVAFQIVAWDGNMPTNEKGWEVWEFIGVWTLQKNITIQRTLMDEEIKQIAKETGFIKKFKYTFTNAFEWMKSKKLWVGYVYKLICRREGATLSIQKVIPFACPRKKPLPPGSKPPPGKGNFQQKGDYFQQKGEKKSADSAENSRQKQKDTVNNEQ